MAYTNKVSIRVKRLQSRLEVLLGDIECEIKNRKWENALYKKKAIGGLEDLIVARFNIKRSVCVFESLRI